MQKPLGKKKKLVVKLSQLWQSLPGMTRQATLPTLCYGLMHWPKAMITGTHVPFRHPPSTDCQSPSSGPCFSVDTLNTCFYKLFCSFFYIIKHFFTAQNIPRLQKEVCQKILSNKTKISPLHLFFKLFFPQLLHSKTTHNESIFRLHCMKVYLLYDKLFSDGTEQQQEIKQIRLLLKYTHSS